MLTRGLAYALTVISAPVGYVRGQGIDIPSNCSPRSHRSLAHIAFTKDYLWNEIDRPGNAPGRSELTGQSKQLRITLAGIILKMPTVPRLQAARERGRKGGRRPKQTQSALRNHSTQLNEGCAASEAARLFHRTTVECIGAEVK